MKHQKIRRHKHHNLELHTVPYANEHDLNQSPQSEQTLLNNRHKDNSKIYIAPLV